MFSQQRAEELAQALSIFGVVARVQAREDDAFMVQIALEGKTCRLEWETQVAQIKVILSDLLTTLGEFQF